MLRVPVLLALLLVGVGGCKKKGLPPPPLRQASVTINGTKILTAPLVKVDERRHALQDYGDLASGSSLLLIYPGKRFHSFFYDRDLGVDSLLVAFIDADRKIVDLQALIRGAKGITSGEETPYVLVTDSATLLGAKAKKGDRVEFSEEVAGYKPEPRPVVEIGDVSIEVELSTSIPERQRGLMYRTQLSERDGMLFAYRGDAQLSFWMANTLLPLSIAYIRSDGTIVKIHHEMMPYDNPADPGDKRWKSDAPAQYALEVNFGFFKEHGVKEGDKVRLPAELSAYTPDAR